MRVAFPSCIMRAVAPGVKEERNTVRIHFRKPMAATTDGLDTNENSGTFWHSITI